MMDIQVLKTIIKDVKIIVPAVLKDNRGFFVEVYRSDIFNHKKLPTNFVQLNNSRSVKNVLRGLHFQWEPPMGKLMREVTFSIGTSHGKTHAGNTRNSISCCSRYKDRFSNFRKICW